MEKAIGRDKARMAELIAEKNELQLSIDEDKKRFDTLNRQISELSSAKKIVLLLIEGYVRLKISLKKWNIVIPSHCQSFCW